MVATTKVAALWDMTRVPTFQGILPLMFGSGIFRNVRTLLPDFGTSRIVRSQCCTKLHDVHVGRPQSSQKKMATLSTVLPAVCVLTLFWIFTCRLFRFRFR
jgi:hypothetical protein